MAQHTARVILTDTPNNYDTKTPSDSELYRVQAEIIGINEVRSLIAEAHRRPQTGYTQKHLIIVGLKITSEAQQATLKILEEPPENCTIILILPTGTQLLSTIHSRVVLEVDTGTVDNTIFIDWQKLSLSERLAEVDSRTKNKDTDWMKSIKQGVQSYCLKNNHRVSTVLPELQLVLEHLLTRGASNKMLLEHLAVNLPLTR